jgi:hypothetical protein
VYVVPTFNQIKRSLVFRGNFVFWNKIQIELLQFHARLKRFLC